MKYVAPLVLVLLVAGCNRPAQDSGGQSAPGPAADVAQAKSQSEPLVAEVVTGVAPVLSGTCNIETVDAAVVQNGDPIQLNGRKFSVGGWVVDEVAGAAPSTMNLRVSSQSGDGLVWQQKVVPSLERPDVQQSHGGGVGALKSGFSTDVDASSLAAGTYRLTLSYMRDNQVVVCDNGRAVVVK